MVRMWLSFCLVFTGVCLSCARSSMPPPSMARLGIYLTSKGADYVNDLMVNKTKSTMEGQKVPAVSISKSIWWNTIRLSLANSKIRSVSLGATSIKFQNGFVKVLIKIDTAEVAGEYNYNGGILGSGRGRYIVKLKNVWITKHLSISVNAKGKPFLINGGCSNWIEDTSPEFSGGASFIINFLVGLVKSSVNNDVRKKICTSINDAVEKGGKMLPTYYPESYNVSRVECAQIKIPILQQPLIVTSYIESLLEGGIKSTCYQLNNSSREDVREIRCIPNPSKMISIVVSDRFLNLLADLYYKAGLMKSLEIQSKDTLMPLRLVLHMTSSPNINTTVNSSLALFKMKAILTTNSSVDDKSLTFTVELKIIGDFYLEEDKKNISGKVKNLRIKPFFTDDIPEKIRPLVLPVLRTHDSKIMNHISSFLFEIAPFPEYSYVHFTNNQFLRKEGFTVFELDIKV